MDLRWQFSSLNLFLLNFWQQLNGLDLFNECIMVSYFKGCLRLVAVTFQITFLFYFLKFIFDITVNQKNQKILKKNYFEAKKK